MIEFARHPEFQAAMYEQVDALWAKQKELSFAALREAPLLEGLIRESLRVHPPLNTLTRRVLEDFKFKDYVIETGKNGMHHLMMELFSLDDVGQGYDIAMTEEERVTVTLGRHTNDFMTSFYCRSPSEFMIEYGWGGREVDMKTWQAVEMFDGPSLWGHERVWLSEKDREIAREMRMNAARQGQRAPVQVVEGNFKLMAGTCPWWDGVKQG